jgi:hypothetical protein
MPDTSAARAPREGSRQIFNSFPLVSATHDAEKSGDH